MAKKRKTRQEKIILQLKRELAREREISAPSSIKSTPRQEAISQKGQIQPKPKLAKKKADASILFYDTQLVKKDLFKTLILALIALSLEFVLYWKLR